MDPLSIIASVIAVCQAGDRIGGLLSCIQTIVNAPGELAALINEVSNIRAAVWGLQSSIAISHGLFPSSGSLLNILEDCLVHIDNIETLIEESVPTRNGVQRLAEEGIIKRTKRMAWMRKRRKVGRIKQQLKDALSAIQLQLLSVNLLVSQGLSYLKQLYLTVQIAQVKPTWLWLSTTSVTQFTAFNTTPNLR